MMRIFDEIELSAVLENHLQKLRADVESQGDNYILNVNEIEFINYLVQEYTVVNIVFSQENIFISSSERDIPAEYFPREFYVHAGRKYKKNVVKYHIPFQGDRELLKCVPSSRLLWSAEIGLEDGCVCFELINFRDNPEEIKREADHIIANIIRQATNVSSEVSAFNAGLRSTAEQAFRSRKERILRTSNFLSALGVPLKKKENYPSTFAIPSPPINRSVKINRPAVSERSYKPEPTLDESTYKDILQVIHDVGKQFERMPSTYADKQEEDLRDLFLLYLEPRFEGSSTGETFNKNGKTDILIRYEGNNVFIAECKFWRGAKAYLECLTQLLGYLTWRDSKAAVILFVKNKDLSSVIEQVQATTQNHSNYLGFTGRVDTTWFSFRFHTNGDRNREVKLAVLVFHVPENSESDGGGSKQQ